MTSILGLAVTVASMLLLYVSGDNARRLAHFLIAGIAILWVVLISGGPIVATLTQAVGRDPTFTARTTFWPMLLAEGMRHPFIGAGFGGYFNTPGNWLLETHGYNVGHNGLLDVFLEIGIAGVVLVLFFHLGLYKRLCRQLDKAFDSRVFGICFLIMSWLSNFSESLFLKSSSYIWSITVVVAIVLLRPKAAPGNRDAGIHPL